MEKMCDSKSNEKIEKTEKTIEKRAKISIPTILVEKSDVEFFHCVPKGGIALSQICIILKTDPQSKELNLLNELSSAFAIKVLTMYKAYVSDVDARRLTAEQAEWIRQKGIHPNRMHVIDGSIAP